METDRTVSGIQQTGESNIKWENLLFNDFFTYHSLNPTQSLIFPNNNLKCSELRCHPLIGYLLLLPIPALPIIKVLDNSPPSHPPPPPISGLLRPLTVWEWPPCLLPTCYNRKLGEVEKEKDKLVLINRKTNYWIVQKVRG